MLLPALLGELTMQISDGDRLENIQKARVYFVDYLQRCKSYAITKEVGVALEWVWYQVWGSARVNNLVQGGL